MTAFLSSRTRQRDPRWRPVVLVLCLLIILSLWKATRDAMEPGPVASLAAKSPGVWAAGGAPSFLSAFTDAELRELLPPDTESAPPLAEPESAPVAEASETPGGDGAVLAPAPTRPLLSPEWMRNRFRQDDHNPETAQDLNRLTPFLAPAFTVLERAGAEALSANAWPRDFWHYQRLMNNPDNWRGWACRVHGTVVRLQPERLGADFVWRATLYDARIDRHYSVLSLRAPSSVETGRTGLSADAVFAGRYAFGTMQGWERTPLFLALDLHPLSEGPTPPERLDERLPGQPYPWQTPARTAAAFDRDFAESLLFDPSYSNARSRAPFAPPAAEMAYDLASEAPVLEHAFAVVFGPSGENPRPNPEIDFDAIMAPDALPGWMRGAWVGVRGRAIGVRTIRYDAGGMGIDRIHLLTIRGHPSEGEGRDWTVALLNLPKGLRFDHEVETTGMLLRRYPFPVGVTGQWKWSPLVVARTIAVVPIRVPSMWWIPAFLLLVIAGLVWLAHRASRDNALLASLRRRGGAKPPPATEPKTKAPVPPTPPEESPREEPKDPGPA